MADEPTTKRMSIPPPAASFRLEVFPDPASGLLITQVQVDGVPIGCVQSLSFEATTETVWPRGRIKVAQYNGELQARQIEKLRAVPWIDLELTDAVSQGKGGSAG